MTTHAIPDWSQLHEAFGLPHDALARSGYKYEELVRIAFSHAQASDSLLSVGNSVLAILSQCPTVHSQRLRVKDPEHLIAKLVRKRCEGGDAAAIDNYDQIITDLVGLRALVLYKEHWERTHRFVTATWALQETPIAYVRAGDSDAVKSAYRDAGCEVKEHPFGYRSVHYLLNVQPTKKRVIVELQVRTLFEEAWSEIDHSLRYPVLSEDPLLLEQLRILNRLAGSADEIGSFVLSLVRHHREMQKTLADAESRLAASEKRLAETIRSLKLSEAQAASLQRDISNLREARFVADLVKADVPRTDIRRAVHTKASQVESSPCRRCVLCGRELTTSSAAGAAVDGVCANCRRDALRVDVR